MCTQPKNYIHIYLSIVSIEFKYQKINFCLPSLEGLNKNKTNGGFKKIK